MAFGPLLAVIFLAVARPAAAQVPNVRSPNILFIMTDQQSDDALSCRMGERFLKTPALDGLAARGTLFTRAYAANPLCVPSRTAMFTGRWGYYRLIEKVDAEIGRVLAALRAADLEKNTLNVFTSDHGECAGAHGLNQKTVLYEESVWVPLIVSHPGQKSARTSDKLVNTGIDLLPTVLDFAGISRPEKLTGLSLRPLVKGAQVAAWRDQVVVQNNMSQAGLVGDSVPMTEGRMLRTDRYEYCVYAQGEHRESLVDLDKDPGEMVNLARDPKFRPVLLENRERLRRFGVDHHDPLVPTLLADDVAPRPFAVVTTPKNPRSAAKRAIEKN